MNPVLAHELVNNRIRDLRHEAALAAGPAGLSRQPGPGRALVSGPVLRSRIGFALVEAGLRLLADRSVTARPGLD